MKAYARFVLFSVILLHALIAQATNTNEEPLFTKAQLLEFSPRARPDLVDALVANQQLLRDAGLIHSNRLAHFFTQVATETGGMQRIDENLNYSFKTLTKVFSRKTISEQKALELANKPQLIANWVYGAQLGNRGRHTNDGWNYRGSGFIQLTGRENFRKRGAEVGLTLEANPEIARQAKEGLMAAKAFWLARDINNAADDNDLRLVRILVNGRAAHGLDAAKMWLPRAKKIFRVKAYEATEDMEFEQEKIRLSQEAVTAEKNAAAEALETMGFLKTGVVESGDLTDDSFATALRAYQQSRELSVTGVLDEDTFYSMTDPLEWRREEPDTQSVLIDDPDGSASHVINAPALAQATVLDPSFGTGVLEDESNSQLSSFELETLSGSKNTYATYEVERGLTDKNDNFIPFGVIEPDDRVVVTDTTAFPARAIVQINFSSRGSQGRHLCSGAMISEDTVLTAGHCVHSGTRNGEWYTDYVVYPGRNTGAKPFGSCSVTKLLALKGWVNATNSDEARYFDLGALKLDCNVGTRTGYFGVRPLADEEKELPTKVQGYAGDKVPAGRQWLSEDKIRVLQHYKGFYQNDTYGGTSGSPVFNGDEYYIIGVHTNGLHDGEPWRSNNAFTRITPSRLREITGWVQK